MNSVSIPSQKSLWHPKLDEHACPLGSGAVHVA
jgi:hypothetical protein